MRTTEARQLLPDAWGFICPVHTPDGSPCGLLNHLTMDCVITDVANETKVNNIPLLLDELGMISLQYVDSLDLKNSYVVQLDGRIIGWSMCSSARSRVVIEFGNILGYIAADKAVRVVNQLRILKIKGKTIPSTLEVVLVPLKHVKSQYPGLYLFTGPARMMRPVLNLYNNKVELVGTFEQVYLDICVSPEEAYKGE